MGYDLKVESKIGVNVSENILNELVARAGFRRSGVSQHNRIIERHKSPFGAYWKSYDFSGSAGRQNVSDHPTGPEDVLPEDKKSNAFKHAGGEIIFNLPNGLQGYLLVGNRGERIKKGPTEIVTDIGSSIGKS